MTRYCFNCEREAWVVATWDRDDGTQKDSFMCETCFDAFDFGQSVPDAGTQDLEDWEREHPCTECDEPGCPGLITCPRCGLEQHGVEHHTDIADHGHCRDCQIAWQTGELPEPKEANDG